MKSSRRFVDISNQDVTIVEAVEVGHAASGRAGGFLALDWCDGQKTEGLARRSFQLHKGLSEELGADTGYRAMNTLSLGVQEGRGGGGGTRGPAWVTGEVTHCEVIGTPDTTAQVHPQLLTRALAAAAQRRGARLVAGEVAGLRLEAGAVTGVSLSCGTTLAADTVVLCMGPWTGRGLRWAGVGRELVEGTRAHSITLQLQDPASSTIDNTALFLSSLRDPEVYPRPDGTVYMCGGCSSDHAPLPPHPRDVVVDTAACAQIKEAAGAVSAELGAVTRYTPSACYLPHSEDGAPLIGHLDQVTSD